MNIDYESIYDVWYWMAVFVLHCEQFNVKTSWSALNKNKKERKKHRFYVFLFIISMFPFNLYVEIISRSTKKHTFTFFCVQQHNILKILHSKLLAHAHKHPQHKRSTCIIVHKKHTITSMVHCAKHTVTSGKRIGSNKFSVVRVCGKSLLRRRCISIYEYENFRLNVECMCVYMSLLCSTAALLYKKKKFLLCLLLQHTTCEFRIHRPKDVSLN